MDHNLGVFIFKIFKNFYKQAKHRFTTRSLNLKNSPWRGNTLDFDKERFLGATVSKEGRANKSSDFLEKDATLNIASYCQLSWQNLSY